MSIPAERAAVAASLPHPDSVTGNQIDNLLRIAGTLMGILIHGRDENIPGASEPDGNVRTSAEATFINVCNRLDDIVKDPKRFNLEFQTAVDQRAQKIHEFNVGLIKAQNAAAEELQTPHFRFRPTFKRTANGIGWIALLGHDADNVIAGIGASPEAALKAFDEVFKGDMPVEMLQFLAEREAAMNAGLQPPDFPKTQNTNEQNKMDGEGSQPAKKPAKRRGKPQSNS
jgi:hypothetical protein